MVSKRILRKLSREDYFSSAVQYFWDKRASQAKDQNDRGVRDQGFRSEATGGKHMDGFFSLIRSLLVDIGVPEDDICTQKRSLDLPGYFRAENSGILSSSSTIPTGRGNLLPSLN
ncbi:PaeR7I family type II restriction endonuclease [Methanoculleus horonobensis]|nr:PaeR7I family type II restriction endonuclease [Methanoculleus horonobensis]